MTVNTGMSNAAVRIENRKKLTMLLYKERGLTKQDLAARLHLSLPTINLLVQQLEDENLIFYQSSEQSSGGRIPNLVCFKYDAYVSVGIEISQMHNRIIIMDMKCAILDQFSSFCCFENKTEYWENLSERMQELLKKNKITKKRMLGVGIAFPGPVQKEEKKVSSWLLGLEDYSYAHFENIFGYPVVIENDANSAGFAEIWLREELHDAAYLSVSKGVGGALINDRTVRRGQNNCCGEFGHLMIVPNGRKCLCGRRGCLDTYCSTNILHQFGGGNISTFFEKKETDEELQKVWNEYLNYLAIGISNIALSLDIPVIIGGEITPYLADNFETVREKIAEIDPFKRTSEMCSLSKLSENGAAIGAALFIVVDFLGIL